MPTDEHKKELLNANKFLDAQDMSFQKLLRLIQDVTGTIENLKQEQQSSLNAVRTLATSIEQNSDKMSGVRDNIRAFDADCSDITEGFDAFLKNFGQHLEALQKIAGQFSSKIPDDLDKRLASIQETQVAQVQHLTDLAITFEGHNASIREKLATMDRDQSSLDRVILRLDKIEAFTQRITKDKIDSRRIRLSHKRDVDK